MLLFTKRRIRLTRLPSWFLKTVSLARRIWLKPLVQLVQHWTSAGKFTRKFVTSQNFFKFLRNKGWNEVKIAQAKKQLGFSNDGAHMVPLQRKLPEPSVVSFNFPFPKEKEKEKEKEESFFERFEKRHQEHMNEYRAILRKEAMEAYKQSKEFQEDKRAAVREMVQFLKPRIVETIAKRVREEEQEKPEERAWKIFIQECLDK